MCLFARGEITGFSRTGSSKRWPLSRQTAIQPETIPYRPGLRAVCYTPLESICACVVSKGGEIPTLAEIRDFLSSHVAKYKLPDELSIFDEFPRLSGGVKLRKFGAGGIQEMAIKDERRESVR